MIELGNLPGKIYYRDGYKYQLTDSFKHQLPWAPPQPITDEWTEIDADGLMTIRYGYAWDGPSGPSIDTKNFMRGSLVHDALYQLLREGLLPEDYRARADLELHRICREDGMSSVRAWYVLLGVQQGAGPAGSQDAWRKTYIAP